MRTNSRMEEERGLRIIDPNVFERIESTVCLFEQTVSSVDSLSSRRIDARLTNRGDDIVGVERERKKRDRRDIPLFSGSKGPPLPRQSLIKAEYPEHLHLHLGSGGADPPAFSSLFAA